MTKQSHHLEVTFLGIDGKATDNAYIRAAAQTMLTGVKEAEAKEGGIAKVLSFQPEVRLGTFVETIELEGHPMRLTGSYRPETLQTQYTLDYQFTVG